MGMQNDTATSKISMQVLNAKVQVSFTLTKKGRRI